MVLSASVLVLAHLMVKIAHHAARMVAGQMIQ
jgi:hypothetical protein